MGAMLYEKNADRGALRAGLGIDLDREKLSRYLVFYKEFGVTLMIAIRGVRNGSRSFRTRAGPIRPFRSKIPERYDGFP